MILFRPLRVCAAGDLLCVTGHLKESVRSLFDDKQRLPNEAVLVPVARERIAVYSVISERRLSFALMAVMRYTAAPTVVTML